MSTNEHTPGEWVLEENGACWNLRSPDRVDHFLILVGMTHNNPGELDANARLVAAAPDLLAALERCMPALGLLIAEGVHERCAAPQEAPATVAQAEAAIAKAKGQP